MKRAVLGFCILCLFALGVSTGVEINDEAADREAVRKVCVDYYEGWFNGEPEVFRNTMHPELAKRRPRMDASGKTYLQPYDRDAMTDQIKGGNTKMPPDETNIEITIYEISDGIATVKGSCTWSYDYLHLAKIDGKWMIVNAIWKMYPQDN